MYEAKWRLITNLIEPLAEEQNPTAASCGLHEMVKALGSDLLTYLQAVGGL